MRDGNNEEGRCFPILKQIKQKSPQTTVLKLKTKGIHLLGTCFLLPLQFVIWHPPYSSFSFYTNFQCFPFWPFDLYNEYLGFIYIFFVWPCGIFLNVFLNSKCTRSQFSNHPFNLKSWKNDLIYLYIFHCLKSIYNSLYNFW